MKPADTDSIHQIWRPVLPSCTHQRHYSSIHHRWSHRKFSLGSRQLQPPMGTGTKWESYLPSLWWGHTSVKGGIIQKVFFPRVIWEKWARAQSSRGSFMCLFPSLPLLCVTLCCLCQWKSWGKVKGRYFSLCFLWCCFPFRLPFPPWTWLPVAIPPWL